MPPRRAPARAGPPRRGRPRATAPPRRGRPRATAPAHGIAEETVAPADTPARSTTEEAVAPAPALASAPAPVPAPVEEVEQTIGARDMIAIIQECFRAIQETRTTGGETRDTFVMKVFQRMRPPTFAGQPDPLAAEEWLNRITKILDSQGITEPHLRIRCATFQFTELADQWWRVSADRLHSFGEGWDAFVAMFNDHYFPETARIGFMDEFRALLQRDMTVTQYESRFTALGRFAPHITREERLRVFYFVKGLKTSIRDKLAGHIIDTYEEAVTRATRVERELADIRRIRESRTQGRTTTTQMSTPAQPIVPTLTHTGGRPLKRSWTDASFPSTSQWPVQFLASQPVMSVAPRGGVSQGPITCYWCRQPGHKMADCPQRDPSQGYGAGPSQMLVPPQAQGQGWGAPRLCYTCHQMGHIRANCPQGQTSQSTPMPNYYQHTQMPLPQPLLGHRPPTPYFPSAPSTQSVRAPAQRGEGQQGQRGGGRHGQTIQGRVYAVATPEASTSGPSVVRGLMAWWEGFDEMRLLVAPDLEATGNCVGRLLSLRHPKSGNTTCYLFDNGDLQEIHWFKQSYGSWFLGDYICEDGRLYAATPVDPVFILLPIFEEARMKKGDDPGKFRRLDEIIFVDGYPGYQHLSSIAEKLMQVVCDFKEIGLTKFFRLNDSKVLAWLHYKVCQLKRTLPTLDKNYAAQDEKDTLADAVSILGEYLKDEPWLKLLCSNLKLDLQVAAKAPDIETLPAIESSPASFNPIQGKRGGDKRTTRSGRETKKAKVEMDTRNIKEMFCRASRRGK